MPGSAPTVGVGRSGGTAPGISASGDTLVLTGARHVTPALMLGCAVTEITEEPDKFRYEIEVDGTAIVEYYEYEEHKRAATVAADWLTDVREEWGDGLANAFRGHVTVTDLWRQTTVDPDSEAQEDQTKDSQEDKGAPLGSEANPVVMPPPEDQDTEE